MRSILINPTERTVTEVEHSGDYQDIYRLLDIKTPFDVRPLGNGESVYFDDEFLLKLEPGDTIQTFTLEGLPEPIGGNGLILGVDGGGNSVATKLALDDVKPGWKTLTFRGWIPGYQKVDTHPLYGKVNKIIGPRPIFDEVEPPSEHSLDEIERVDQAYYKRNDTFEQAVNLDTLEHRVEAFNRAWRDVLDRKPN